MSIDQQNYQKNGFILIKGFFKPEELLDIHKVVQCFHDLWIKDNAQFYNEKAVNSAYLTKSNGLNHAQRMVLFRLLSCDKISRLLQQAIPESATFMNTQLFFNPQTKNQKNYWHRDPQYHLSMDQQKEALKGPDVLHIRVPLKDEPGIEIIPGSHVGWDTPEELAVRMEQDGHVNSEDLSAGLKIPLQVGDVLLFSANMIHRGLYGLDRFALDLLYFKWDSEILKFVDQDCLPNEQEMEELNNPPMFVNAKYQEMV